MCGVAGVEMCPQEDREGHDEGGEYPAERVRQDALEEHGAPGQYVLLARWLVRGGTIGGGRVITVVLAVPGGCVDRLAQLAAPTGRYRPVQVTGRPGRVVRAR